MGTSFMLTHVNCRDGVGGHNGTLACVVYEKPGPSIVWKVPGLCFFAAKNNWGKGAGVAGRSLQWSYFETISMILLSGSFQAGAPSCVSVPVALFQCRVVVVPPPFS